MQRLVTGGPPGMLAIMMLVVFTAGADVGARAGPGEVAAVEDNITTIDDEVVSDVRNNTTGVAEPLIVQAVKWPVEGIVGTAQYGLAFGQAQPALARVWVPVGYLLTPVATLAYLFVRLRSAMQEAS